MFLRKVFAGPSPPEYQPHPCHSAEWQDDNQDLIQFIPHIPQTKYPPQVWFKRPQSYATRLIPFESASHKPAAVSCYHSSIAGSCLLLQNLLLRFEQPVINGRNDSIGHSLPQASRHQCNRC